MKNLSAFLSFGNLINTIIPQKKQRMRFVACLLCIPILAQSPSFAQPLCDYPVQCYDTGNPNDYTIISGPFGGEVLLSTLISNHTVLPHIDLNDPSNDAQHKAQHLEIRSPLRMNVPYTFAEGSELVCATPSARVHINSDLTINSSHLHGCDLRWKGLIVEENGKLLAYNNCIEDAEVAIRLFDGAEFEIKENSFRRNAFSIFGGRENISDLQEAYLTPVGVGISGNDISGADDLIEPFDGFLRPLNAIRLHSVAEITIGGEDEINSIHDFAHSNPNTLSPIQALFSFNTNLTVQKTKFYNIGYDLNSGGYAIYSYNEGSQKQLNVFGLGKNNTTPTFQACQTGIYSESNGLTVQNCFFNFGTQHVKLDFTNFPHRFDISQNRFKSYETSGISCPASRYIRCNIYSNLFEDDVNALDYHDDPGLPTGTLRCEKHAIIATGLVGQGPPQPGFDLLGIFGNTFKDIQKLPAADNLSGGYGLTFIFMKHIAEVHNNTFNQQHVGASKHFYKGVFLYQSSNNKIFDNTLTGVADYSGPINDQFESLSGISAWESSNNTIKCNHLYNLHEGMRFHSNCDGTILRSNLFANHNTGLLMLTGSTRIGVQEKRKNIWPGISGLPDSEAFFGGNPNLQFIELSKFRIHYFETPTSIYWANPRSHQGWFEPAIDATPDPNELPQILCPEESEEESESEKRYLQGTFPVYKGYVEMNWEVGFGLYDRLFYHPELRPEGSPKATFFAAQATTNLGKLHNALQQYAQANAFPGNIMQEWDDNYTQISGVLAQMKANHDAMAEATTQAQKDQLSAELLGLNSQLQSLNVTKQSLEAVHLSERLNKINQLDSYLSSITTNAVYESNLKTVLTVLKDDLAANTQNNYTAQQKASLESVANQCRFSGGYGVVLARAILKKSPQDYNDEAMCPGGSGAGDGSEERSQLLKGSVITLSPNPVSDHLQVILPRSFEIGTLYLYDFMGRLIREDELGPDTQTITLDLSTIPLGTYTVQAILDSQKMAAKRFVKVAQ
ncbi:MAG: right-handed parallel beta-helix repeat-containing protein [Saprospiraceae bacterium]|nr:right-handed parallel beta-helix repeat-containing protein [Saprospiraceae bacterium]